MPTPQVPKYQAIYTVLRQQILDGDFAPGEQLPPQQELADGFGVTLMTLRQAVSALESDGLVWAARGKGTFVADRPVDISVGNLSSFAQQMRSAGIDLVTDVLAVDVVAAGAHQEAATALGVDPDGGADLVCLTRLRQVDQLPISLQRSSLLQGLVPLESGGDLVNESLYETIEAATGWTVAEARESITAVRLSAEEAEVLETEAGNPALLSIRISINQFDRAFLYDEAVLVGGRCTIAADRSADRLALRYDLG